MLDQVLSFFEIKPDYDLDIMQADQTLFDVTANGLKKLEKVFDDCKPECVFVQGDTTTSFIGALAAYYKKVKIAHVEAGLRSHNKYSPFPEEVNRTLAGHMADFHFAPTEQAVRHLAMENISSNVYNVGNTVIDALFLGLEQNKKKGKTKNNYDFLNTNHRMVLITGHRRESFGKPFEDICEAIRSLSIRYPDVEFVYPVHLNPNVREPVNRLLIDLPNVHLIEPLEYPEFIEMIEKSTIVLTDSGGLQEEAPSLGKPVLVMREVTERMEGVEAGTAMLVGTDKNLIVSEMSKLLDDKSAYDKMAKAVNPYGDGSTCVKIADVISALYSNTK
jgi:UDP-N-acetylglucosamine 2-epimerase (non-hydrolysing)